MFAGQVKVVVGVVTVGEHTQPISIPVSSWFLIQSEQVGRDLIGRTISIASTLIEYEVQALVSDADFL